MPKRYSTRRSYDSWLDNHILPKWGENPITDLQARPVELWLESLMLSSRSKSSIRGLLSALLDYAMWRGDLPVQRNPMELVAVKNATKRTRQPHSLTVEDFQKFLQHLDESFRTISLVCVCFGLRISECLALKWSDVDWLNGNLSVQRGIVRQRVDDVKTKPRTHKRRCPSIAPCWMCSRSGSRPASFSPRMTGSLPHQHILGGCHGQPMPSMTPIRRHPWQRRLTTSARTACGTPTDRGWTRWEPQ